jgi:hypothetical protein
MEKQKKNVKNQNKKKRLFRNVGRFSTKSDGSTAGRLPSFYEKKEETYYI